MGAQQALAMAPQQLPPLPPRPQTLRRQLQKPGVHAARMTASGISSSKKMSHAASAYHLHPSSRSTTTVVGIAIAAVAVAVGADVASASSIGGSTPILTVDVSAMSPIVALRNRARRAYLTITIGVSFVAHCRRQ